MSLFLRAIFRDFISTTYIEQCKEPDMICTDVEIADIIQSVNQQCLLGPPYSPPYSHKDQTSNGCACGRMDKQMDGQCENSTPYS